MNDFVDEDEEMWQVRLLLKALGVDSATLARGVPPEPDVIVRLVSNAEPIGVEVTHIHPLGSELRRVEGELDAIIDLAKTKYDAAGHPPALVTIVWSNDFRPPKQIRQRAAGELASVVAANIPGMGERRVVDACDEPPPRMPLGVDRVTIDCFPEIESFWHSPKMTFAPEIDREQIDEAVLRKNPKVQNYRDQYSSKWLLLVAGGAGPSTWGLIAPHLKSHVFESTFDRLFVFNRLQLALLELPVESIERAT